MPYIDNLFVGWLNTNIGEIVEQDIATILTLPYALLTSLDSTRELASSPIGQKIRQRHQDCQFLGQGIVMPSRILSDADRSLELFHGFDEIWFFATEPSLAMPADVWLVGPFNIGVDALPPGLADWMDASDCKLGLGDGVGLNFVTPDKDIAFDIESRTAAKAGIDG